jgi:hypothetical protein
MLPPFWYRAAILAFVPCELLKNWNVKNLILLIKKIPCPDAMKFSNHCRQKSKKRLNDSQIFNLYRLVSIGKHNPEPFATFLCSAHKIPHWHTSTVTVCFPGVIFQGKVVAWLNGAAWLIWCGLALWCGMAYMVRRGSYGAAWLLWCGVAHMVRRGSVGSASACCKAGRSSILGSAPQGSFPH